MGWLYSREKREEARKQRIETKDEDFNTFGTQFFDRLTSVPIHQTRPVKLSTPDSTSWERYVQIMRGMPQSRDELGKFLSEFDPFEALLYDPGTVEWTEIEETVKYLIEYFDAIAEVRFPGGSKESKPYEDFIAALGKIELLAIEACSVFWPKRGDWIRRVVVPEARDRLKRAAATWRVRASVLDKHTLRLQAIQNNFERAPEFYKPLGINPVEYHAWKKQDWNRCSYDKRRKIETAADKLPLEGPFKSPGPAPK